MDLENISPIPSGVGNINNNEQQDENQKTFGSSNFRSIASQCCGVLAAACLKFSTGTFNGFHIILIAELSKKNAEISISLDQLTWIASFNFLMPIGSVMNGFITQRLGSRFTMLTSSLLFLTMWLCYTSATSVTTLVVVRILHALTNGALRTPLSTYVAEITEPRLRSSFMATANLAGTCGSFFSMLLATLLYWRTIALINILFPIISFVVILFIPDSPYWLTSKGRLKDAETSLAWLRGWVEPIHVRSEYHTLIESIQTSSTESATHSTNENISDKNKREKWKKLFKSFLHRSFYLPLASITLIFLIHFFSGPSALLTYSTVIFGKMKSPINESVATAIMGAMRVVGAIVVLFTIRWTGKRKLVFTSLVIAGSCYLIIGGVGFAIREKHLDSAVYRWISPIAMILAIFANSSGSESIVHMLNSEIFPVSTRYIGAAMGSSIGAIAQSIMNKFFLYIVDGITLPGIFLYFALMTVVAIVVYNFVIPETEGRTLKEIEDHYGGVKSLNDSSINEKPVTNKITNTETTKL